MLTEFEEYMESVMFEVGYFMRRAMHTIQFPGCESEELYKGVVWDQMLTVLALMNAVMVVYGPEVNKYFDYLRYLREEWIELMDTFRAVVSLEDGPFIVLDMVDDESLESFQF